MIVWLLLTIPGVRYAIRWIQDPWYSVVAFAIVVPFIATFFLYGPVLLVRQILSSGDRGRFVARVFLSIVVVLAALFAILYITGHSHTTEGIGFVFAISAGVTIYLNWRIRKGQPTKPPYSSPAEGSKW